MPTISVRVSEEEKKKLLEHGRLSDSVREALQLYLETKESRKLIERLEGLQRKNRVMTAATDEVRMIAGDRRR